MLIDPVPLFSQIFITLLVSINDDNEMDGSFSHIFFYILSRTRPLY